MCSPIYELPSYISTMVLTEMPCLETSGKSEAEDAEMMDPAAGILDGY